MNFFKNIRFLIVLIFSFIGISIFFMPLSYGQEETNNRSERIVLEGRFIDLFHESKGRFLTAGASKYIDACCKSRDAAVALLQRNGFSLSVVNDPERVFQLNEHWKTEKDPFDEFIFGRRGTGALRFWQFFTQYKVTLFIRDGMVERVYAVVNTTYP